MFAALDLAALLAARVAFAFSAAAWRFRCRSSGVSSAVYVQIVENLQEFGALQLLRRIGYLVGVQELPDPARLAFAIGMARPFAVTLS